MITPNQIFTMVPKPSICLLMSLWDTWICLSLCAILMAFAVALRSAQADWYGMITLNQMFTMAPKVYLSPPQLSIGFVGIPYCPGLDGICCPFYICITGIIVPN